MQVIKCQGNKIVQKNCKNSFYILHHYHNFSEIFEKNFIVEITCLMGEGLSPSFSALVPGIRCFCEFGRRTLSELRSLISCLLPAPRLKWSWRYSSTGRAGFRTDWNLLEFLVCMKKASHNPTSFSRKSKNK